MSFGALTRRSTRGLAIPTRDSPLWGAGSLRRRAQRLSHITFIPASTMSTKTSHQNVDRARRFPLHLAIYFREPQSPTWSEGMTENISYTGVLFRSTHPFVPETSLELKLQLAVGTQLSHASEIRCKGAVVRVEQRNAPETPIALAVSIRDYRIVRQAMLGEDPVGLAKSTSTAPKTRRRPS